MSDLKDVIYFLVKNYPHTRELSNARLTKMVYLADWLHTLNHGQQMTNLRWYYDNYGPFVWDILRVVEGQPDLFSCTVRINSYGTPKTTFSLAEGAKYAPPLQSDEMATLQEVINQTESLYWDDFITLIYSTYPVLSGEKYGYLDLAKARDEYRPSGD